VSQQLNDKDIDRIASRVVQKLVWYAVVIVAAIVALPALFVTVQYAGATITRGLPPIVAVAITASFIAVPLIALIWFWGRRRRA
jgi:protein-S-isoprenylcysteine O-methyltransferase Ste14